MGSVKKARERPVQCARGCGNAIVFVKSAKTPEPGKKQAYIPVNAEAAIWVRPRPTLESLRTTIVTDDGEMVSGDRVPEGFQDISCKRGRRVHFSTCPYGQRRRSA